MVKIYEYTKGENERTAKILGFPIMKQTSDYMTAERHQSFIGGLVTTVKLNDIYTDRSKKDIKIFGKSVIRRTEENNFRNYYIFNKKFHSVSLINEFKKQYFKYFNKEHDDIYILRANSGEAYLTLTYTINTLLERNKSKKPLLIATQEYHVDMIKMLCPDIPYIYIGKLRIKISEDNFRIGGFNFHLLFSNSHFKQVEMDIKSHKLGQHHYFKSILNRLNMTLDDIQMNKATMLSDAEKSMQSKIKDTNLNLEKFVFIAPEAQSCKLYDEDFWVLLINKFKNNGYDVFVNLVEDEIKLKGAIDYKTCYLTYSEAFCLAKLAKKIVSLRSGFTEFLLQTQVPIDVLYTKFRHRHFFDDMDIEHVVSGFSITQIPFVDTTKIQEFNMFETSQKECLTNLQSY